MILDANCDDICQNTSDAYVLERDVCALVRLGLGNYDCRALNCDKLLTFTIHDFARPMSVEVGVTQNVHVVRVIWTPSYDE